MVDLEYEKLRTRRRLLLSLLKDDGWEDDLVLGATVMK
jgi:hypothetical protein